MNDALETAFMEEKDTVVINQRMFSLPKQDPQIWTESSNEKKEAELLRVKR